MSKNIEGLSKLLQKLECVKKESVREALINSCLLVEAEAKELCPVDDGPLRQSITFEIVDDNTGAVGTNVEYAPYVHQGTGIFAVNGDGRKDPWSYQDAEGKWHTTKGQKPQPFLEKALDNKKKEIIKIFQEEIRGAAK